MKHIAWLLVVVAVLVGGCSSSSSEVESATATSEAPTEGPASEGATSDGSSAGASEEASESSETESMDGVDEADPAGALDDSASDSAPAAEASVAPTDCIGANATSEPETIEVEQIAGADRTEASSALANSENPNFAEPLVDVSRIISGGPPPDGIPPIDTPRFHRASTIDWLSCNAPVLVLTVDSEARAYPVQIMTWHEIVNDTFGDTPVTVSFCPLCNSAVAYRREIDGLVLDFGTSGRLFNSSLVMYDRQTESLWTHFNGQAVVGELTGTQLDLLAVQTTSWASFRDAHPDGLVLSRKTGFERPYGQNPYVGYDDVTQNPFLFDGEADPRLAAKQRVVAIRDSGDSTAIVLDELVAAGTLSVEVGGDALTAWNVAGTSSALDTRDIDDGRDIGAVGVFRAEVDGTTLSFTRTPGNAIIDDEGSTWNILGMAIDGPRAGTQLEAVEHLDTFWFAIAAFSPDTTIVGR